MKVLHWIDWPAMRSLHEWKMDFEKRTGNAFCGKRVKLKHIVLVQAEVTCVKCLDLLAERSIKEMAGSTE